jgi:1-(5-phosphoribosyl)-5-[(5-phosphoribosylamino)methylideneamino] imidazole-4-carboxamide isomerase (EC 5.3.1.16)
MQLIPAIDLKDGKCVRLRQGRMDDETIFSDDPLEVAQRWVDAGARRLHLVDLDGAVQGFPFNADLIGRIAETHRDVEIQVGGGIRSFEVIQTYLDVGVNFVIIGTQAVRTPNFVDEACLEFPGILLSGLMRVMAGWQLMAGLKSLTSRQAIWPSALKMPAWSPLCSPTLAVTA